MSNSVKGNVVAHGTVGGTAISSSVDVDGLGSTQHVTLSGDYARVIPPGYPDPNAGSEPKGSATATAKTILSGARVLLFKHEAAALVAAGKASNS